MGLGKTVQALALIYARPAPTPYPRATLIVAPLSLLHQWQREIATKSKADGPALSVLLYDSEKARSRAVKHKRVSHDYDVVLCTYGKIANESKMIMEQGRKDDTVILHEDTHWYRAILDEAHNIKNKNAKASIGVTRIKAEYKLCMTGTPFMNNSSELYPLIRFLGIQPFCIEDSFNDEIDRPLQRWQGDVKTEAMRKLHSLLRSTTLRRTKDSILDGQRIIQLPPRHDIEDYVEFDEDQQAFYDALQEKQRLRFNKYVKEGSVTRSYTYILVLLLRLRQVCDHPHLIKNHGVPEGTNLSQEDMVELAIKLLDVNEEAVARVKSIENFECPICEEGTTNPVIISPCGHHICSECFSTSMTVRQTETGRDTEPGRIYCPGDGNVDCPNEILSTEIIMYDCFHATHCVDTDDDI